MVSEFGQKLRINSLQGADHACPATHKQTVQFAKPELKDWEVPYVSKFAAEMVRQLQQQETGTNRVLTWDLDDLADERGSPALSHLRK